MPLPLGLLFSGAEGRGRCSALRCGAFLWDFADRAMGGGIKPQTATFVTLDLK